MPLSSRTSARPARASRRAAPVAASHAPRTALLVLASLASLTASVAASPAPVPSPTPLMEPGGGGRGAPAIASIDLEEVNNPCQHRTWDYSTADYLTLRRGDTFAISVKVNNLGVGHVIRVVCTHTFDGAPVSVAMPAGNALPADGWAAKLDQLQNLGGGASQADLLVQIPGDASIGAYDFTVEVVNGGGAVVASGAFAKQVLVLFNPWSAKDKDVFLDDDAQRGEYVLETRGELSYGSVNYKTGALARGTTKWDFGQFERISVKVALKQLEGLSAADRRSALAVTQRLNKKVAAKVDLVGPPAPHAGILHGKWTGGFTDENKPGRWKGSAEIFRRYDASGGGAVQYGQCWVFSALLTSMSRSMGIPARSHSTFNAGWEKGKLAAATIDLVWAKDTGRFLSDKSDGSWNYHVWTDVRIKHDGANPTWQSCDPTYNTYMAFGPMGPAPLAKIKAKAGGNFSTPFFSTAVDGDRKEWTDAKLDATLATYTGWFITTKKLGEGGSYDITADFKTPEAIPAPPPAGGVGFSIDAAPAVTPGQPVTFALTVWNADPFPHMVNVRRTVDAGACNGEREMELFHEELPLDLAGGSSQTFTYAVSPSDYAAWAGSLDVLFMDASILDLETDEPVGSSGASTLIMRPESTVALAEPGPFVAGALTVAQASCVNPLPVTLHNARILFSCDEGALIDGAEEAEILVGDVPPGGSAEALATVVMIRQGLRRIAATMVADELASTASLASAVVAPAVGPCAADLNGDGGVDGADLGLLLANWGSSCSCGCAFGDLDGSGLVDGADLSLVLAAWGPCP